MRPGVQVQPPARALRRGAKISEVLAREIVHDIAARQLTPSTMLPPEAVMLEHYGVGRASLREALRILEVQGLIVIKPGPGGGPMVAAVDSRHFGRMATLHFHVAGATFRDVLQARLVIEPVMARLAAQRQDPVRMAELQAVLTESASESADDHGFLRASTEFHALVCGMSGNPVLDLFGRSVKDVFTDRLEGLLMFPPDDRRPIIEAHTAIARAITSGNASQAERLMREHMEEFAESSAARYPHIFDEVVDWS